MDRRDPFHAPLFVLCEGYLARGHFGSYCGLLHILSRPP